MCIEKVVVMRSGEELYSKTSHVQSVQREVETNDIQHEKHGVLRDLRDHSQHTMPQLHGILAERYCTLHMRNMLTPFRQSSETQQ